MIRFIDPATVEICRVWESAGGNIVYSWLHSFNNAPVLLHLTDSILGTVLLLYQQMYT